MTVAKKNGTKGPVETSSDDAFQQFLLGLSKSAAQAEDSQPIIQEFCQAARELLQVSGIYYWQVSGDSLLGIAAEGSQAKKFKGFRLGLNERSVAVATVRSRQTSFVNNIDPAEYPVARMFGAGSILATPLVVSGEVVGAITFVEETTPDFFTNDHAEKATILGTVLGHVVESSRMAKSSREERRRAELLLQCAQVLHSRLDSSRVISSLASSVRELLAADTSLVLLRTPDGFSLDGISAISKQVEHTIRDQHEKGCCQFAQTVARRVMSQGEPIILHLDSEMQSEVPEFLRGGELLAAPLGTGQAGGVVLVHRHESGAFREQDRSLLAAVAEFGALAVANADLFATSNSRARELQQLLEITSELAGLGNLDEFFQKFVVRATEFLNFGRAALALAENGHCTMRWMAEDGQAHPLQLSLHDAFAQRLLKNAEPFYTDDITRIPDCDQDTVRRLELKQFLSVPLMGSDKKPLGLLAVMDRKDGAPIAAEDIRRAKVLAVEGAVVLEATHHLHVAKEHRERSENLMSLALELNSSLRLPQFIRSFTQRAADMLGARAAVLALAQRSTLEAVIVHDPNSVPDKSLLRRLNIALTELAANTSEAISAGGAERLLGSQVAGPLGWRNLTVARLRSGDGELIGMLCLVDREQELGELDRNLLQALSAHASVALENARLFTRMDQANRHWIEIFDSITDFIVVHDENNRVLRVNRTLADFIGVRPSELIGVSMRALVAMASDNSAQPCPFCRVGLDGADEYIHPVLERTYLVSTSRIHGALNEGFQTIHVLKDITDRREAERRYRELFDTIQEGLFFSTPDGRFIEVNDALVRMLGYDSREELLQVDIAPQLYLSTDQRSEFRKIIEETGTLRNYEETLRKKDGSLIHTLQNAFAVRDSQGKILQYRGLILDITEQKNFQSELQRQRDFNSKILNATQSMILVVDTAGLISYGNRRCFEAGGYLQEELLGRKITEIVAPGRRDVLADALNTTLRGMQVDNLELPILLGRGRVGQFAINLSPMRDESGHVSSIVVVMTDITDAAMLQAKLMHTEKMAAVGQLVSGVAHEVNNPLTAILGFADLLLDHPEVPEFAKTDLRVILEEAQRTKQIVQNLLSFARQMPPQRKAVQINAILRQTLALRSYDFANHGVEVVEKFAQGVPEVIGDSHQLQQVFLNILNNAYDAVRECDRAGKIVIETLESEGFAEITFRDNGPGILYPERIFDPFFTTKEVGKGTGLGLSICYGIVREHAGEILCRNNGDGPGATFIVRLPLASERVSAQSAGAKR